MKDPSIRGVRRPLDAGRLTLCEGFPFDRLARPEIGRRLPLHEGPVPTTGIWARRF